MDSRSAGTTSFVQFLLPLQLKFRKQSGFTGEHRSLHTGIIDSCHRLLAQLTRPTFEEDVSEVWKEVSCSKPYGLQVSSAPNVLNKIYVLGFYRLQDAIF